MRTKLCVALIAILALLFLLSNRFVVARDTVYPYPTYIRPTLPPYPTHYIDPWPQIWLPFVAKGSTQ